MVNVMTYEALYDTLRREKTKVELQKLPPNFLEDLARYLKEKDSILNSDSKKNNVFGSRELERTEMQIKNSGKILNELKEKRESKITQLSLSSTKTNKEYVENLEEHEKELYEDLKKLFLGYRVKLDLKLENFKEGETSDKIKLKFLEGVPEFVGEDMVHYGPYEVGNDAEIPPQVAEILLKNRNAEKI
jgi:DNA replication initiation complex subunit (GINS family)